MRPTRRYRFTFTHPYQTTVVLEQVGETRCLARGFAWQDLEAHLAASGLDRDAYWKLTAQDVLEPA